jgi:hypothetical protein
MIGTAITTAERGCNRPQRITNQSFHLRSIALSGGCKLGQK